MSLAITRDEIYRALARNLGWDASNLTATQSQTLADAVRRGLSDFYMPRRVAEGQPPHVWSFLQRDFSVNTTQDVNTVALPADFSQLTDGLSHAPGSGLPPVALVSEMDIRNLRGAKNETGPPRYAAVIGGGSASSTSYSLTLYPTPYSVYALSGRYRFEPDDLSGGSSTPLGGALHSETIITACLVASDKLINPELGESKYETRYQQLLMASMEQDASLQAPVGGVVWPTDFPEGERLEITKSYLASIVGNALGFPAESSIWTHQQKSIATEVIRSGLRRFQSPALVAGPVQHQWSFLRPISRMDLTAGTYQYTLPADFAMLRGPMTYAPGTYTLYPDIELVGEEKVRQMLQFTDLTSRPTMAAVVSQAPGQTGHRKELWVYPKPDADYEILIRYSVNMIEMEDDDALPVGGPPHSQTLIEACLAAAEAYSGKAGLHTKLFMECLAASISHDQQLAAADTYGVNWDRSDRRRGGDKWWRDFHEYDNNIVTYNGNVY